MRVRHSTLLAVAVAGTAALTACGSDDQGAAQTDTVVSMAEETTIAPTDPGENDDSAATPVTTPEPVATESGPATSGPQPTFTATPLSPEAGSTAMPPGDDIDHGEAIVQAAIADLADRLGVTTDDIEVVAARAVTWPDSSTGCPEPGMQYLQRLTDGALVVLGADGNRYQYHGGTPLVLCEHPAVVYGVD